MEMVTCPRCRRPIPYRTPVCGHCGHAFVGGDDAAVRLLIPVGRTALSMIAGYVGLLSLVLFPLAPVAIVLGVLAIRDLKRRPGKAGMGRAIFAIIAGALITVAVAAILLAAR